MSRKIFAILGDVMKDYRMIFKKKRKKMGLNQDEMADLLGISQSFVSGIENGKKNPSLEIFFMICDILEIELFPDEDG